MTPPPMQMSVLKMLAAGVAAVLMVGILATWWSSRGDQAESGTDSGAVRIVAARSDAIEIREGTPSGAHSASPDADPAVALQTLVASSFPNLSNVEARCSEQACEVGAAATVPAGGQDLADYERMIRFDIPAVLRQRGHALTEAPQVEDVGDGSVRIILHAGSGG